MANEVNDVFNVLSALSTEEGMTAIDGVIEGLKPLANKFISYYDKLVTNGNLARIDAEAKMNSYNAYMKAGFTENQAFMLLLDGNARKSDLTGNITKLIGGANTNNETVKE